jgi:predicted lipid-binding transport protein (Tim44 family)
MENRIKPPAPGRRAGVRGRLLAGAATGVMAAGLLFAVAELLSAFFGTTSSPLTAVGSTFIDFTPAWMKNFAVATFGTNDKTVLLLSMAVVAVKL